MSIQTCERKPYPSDLTDAQWQLLEPLIPAIRRGGRPARYSRREIVNAVLYVTRNGCAWRALPHDLPPWSLVHYYFWHWQQDGTWQMTHDALRAKERRRQGRDPDPSAAILDSQSVRTTEKGGRVAVTAARKSMGASGICSWTRAASF